MSNRQLTMNSSSGGSREGKWRHPLSGSEQNRRTRWRIRSSRRKNRVERKTRRIQIPEMQARVAGVSASGCFFTTVLGTPVQHSTPGPPEERHPNGRMEVTLNSSEAKPTNGQLNFGGGQWRGSFQSEKAVAGRQKQREKLRAEMAARKSTYVGFDQLTQMRFNSATSAAVSTSSGYSSNTFRGSGTPGRMDLHGRNPETLGLETPYGFEAKRTDEQLNVREETWRYSFQSGQTGMKRYISDGEEKRREKPEADGSRAIVGGLAQLTWKPFGAENSAGVSTSSGFPENTFVNPSTPSLMDLQIIKPETLEEVTQEGFEAEERNGKPSFRKETWRDSLRYEETGLKRYRVCGSEQRRRKKLRAAMALAAATISGLNQPRRMPFRTSATSAAVSTTGSPLRKELPSTLRGQLHETKQRNIPLKFSPPPAIDTWKRNQHSATEAEEFPASGLKDEFPTTTQPGDEHLRVAIVDKQRWMSDSVGRLSAAQAELLREQLTEMLLDRLIASGIDRPAPTFRSWNYTQETVKITCENEQSLEWLKASVASLQAPWSGARLEVVPVDRLPSRFTKASVWMPGRPVDKEVALRVLALQNPWARCDTWRVFHDIAKESPEGRVLVFGVGERAREALEERDGRVAYMFRTLEVKLHRRNDLDPFAATPPGVSA